MICLELEYLIPILVPVLVIILVIKVKMRSLFKLYLYYITYITLGINLYSKVPESKAPESKAPESKVPESKVPEHIVLGKRPSIKVLYKKY